MNKTSLAVLLLSAAGSFAGQAYLGGGAGLAFGAPGRVLGQDGNENIYGSLGGDALDLGIHAGIRGSGGVGGEIGLEWQHGFEQTTEKQNVLKTTSELSGLWIVPSVTVLSRGATISPYARFGLVFGTALEQAVETATAATGHIDRTVYRGGGAWGFVGGLGAEIKATPRASIVLELQAREVQWMPDEKEFGTTRKYDDPPSAAAGELQSIAVDLSSMQVRLGLNYAL